MHLSYILKEGKSLDAGLNAHFETAAQGEAQPPPH
jgi:hypothetical protein